MQGCCLCVCDLVCWLQWVDARVKECFVCVDVVDVGDFLLVE